MKSAKSLVSSTRSCSRRVPLNTIILPPLSPSEDNNELRIFHNLLLGKSNGSTVSGELVAVARSAELGGYQNNSPKEKDVGRIVQLEQNIRFLQDQHTQMLAGLHKEIDNLRHKNRELQFQLIFTKGGISSSPSSPEDDTKPKVYYTPSPKQVNVTPLQVEILEKDLGELKLQIHEIDSRNSYLSAIVDEQQKKLERYEHECKQEQDRVAQHDAELLRKLEDAESLIRLLRKENTELRHETALSHATSSDVQGKDFVKLQRGSQSRNSSNGRHRGNSASHYRGNWFPPLNAQTYWNGRKIDRNGSGQVDGGPLPSLTSNNGQFHHYNRGSNNNNYRNGETRIFRNGGPKQL